MDDTDTAKLRTLLGYWAEHNREHSQEFRHWAERVAGLGETADDLRFAADEMDRAGEHLSRALRRLQAREA